MVQQKSLRIILCFGVIFLLSISIVSASWFSDFWKKIIGWATEGGDIPGGGCTPDCIGKQCGDNGCGGSCGDCGKGESCENNVCVCTPNCAGKQCGDNGCGGSCGSCSSGEICSGGVCVFAPSVGSGPSNSGNTTGSLCTPNCAGKQCGDNGCGGSCGDCSQGYVCADNLCALKCTPNCEGKECGTNGCAGSCGICGPGYSCFKGDCFSSQESCVDSDVDHEFRSGLNYLVKGAVIFSSQRTDDFCLDDKILREGYCEDGISKEKDYSCPEKCEDGQCVKIEYTNCHKTDLDNIFENGKVCFDRVDTGEEVCFSEDFCGEGAGSLGQIECVSGKEYDTKWYGCLFGCNDGACTRPLEAQLSNQECVLNFECETGICIEGKCIKRDNFERVMLWVGDLFG